MIYGDLRLRDRLIRAAFGGILGGGVGFFLGLHRIIWRSYPNALPVLVATIVGAAIGTYLAFRRKRIGW